MSCGIFITSIFLLFCLASLNSLDLLLIAVSSLCVFLVSLFDMAAQHFLALLFAPKPSLERKAVGIVRKYKYTGGVDQPVRSLEELKQELSSPCSASVTSPADRGGRLAAWGEPLRLGDRVRFLCRVKGGAAEHRG